MDVINMVLNAAVLLAVGLVLARINKDRFDQLEKAIDGLRQELDERLGELRGETREQMAQVRGEIGEVRREMGIMRSDITRIALAVIPREQPNAG